LSATPFTGFQSGSRATIIPNVFFSVVLPEVLDQRELLVSIYAFFVVGRQRGNPRSISADMLACEQPLMRALARLDADSRVALQEGLTAAAARGTLIIVGREQNGSPVYALNTGAARRAAAEGGLLGGSDVDLLAESDVDLIEVSQRNLPNIFKLYEENIGTIPPILVDEIHEAETLYPRPWIEAAFKEAVVSNRRSWRYIARILERWKLEGPDYETSGGSSAGSTPGFRRSVGGPYRRIVDRRR
jgi:DnaD/phage-associated family protein